MLMLTQLTGRKYRVLNFFIICSIYALWVYLEQTYLKEPLYQLSLEHIKLFRNHASSHKVFDITATLLSQIGDKLGLAGCALLVYQCNNPAHSFISGTNTFTFAIVSQTMKSILKEPRPLMVDGGINVEDCKHMEFGNPSSHTFGATFCWIVAIYLTLRHCTYHYKLQNHGRIVLKVLITAFLGILLMGFSRVYKGVHTYNQVLSGLIQGLLLVVLQVVCFHQAFYEFFHSIKDRSLFGLIINRFTFGYSLLMGIAIAVHFHTEATWTVPEEWVKNIQRQCGDTDKMIIDPERANFQKVLMCFAMIGLYLGVIIEQKFLDSRNYPYFYDTDLVTTIKRTIFCNLAGGPLLLPMVLIPRSSPYWIVIIFKTWLPPFLSSFYLFGFSKSVAIYLGLANTERKYKTEDEAYDYMNVYMIQEQPKDKKTKQK